MDKKYFWSFGDDSTSAEVDPVNSQAIKFYGPNGEEENKVEMKRLRCDSDNSGGCGGSRYWHTYGKPTEYAYPVMGNMESEGYEDFNFGTGVFTVGNDRNNDETYQTTTVCDGR